MPLVYNIAWLCLAVALPANFSLRALLDYERDKEENKMDNFWLNFRPLVSSRAGDRLGIMLAPILYRIQASFSSLDVAN
ncbi:Oidioi.mRNA.OKI2018_I69.XSR.g14726.t1.cds [Oikopleura dioica]|uniref:Oidioi.mRNA.OKI2018_I69.XSR.g14726.t1.cds n=1 Tax=Oikopleura dioica TaxID=34765 RepID=A0ABN7SFV4_OIKDI|nr:Oidioi.mRNA.OKI2018_I69.XSR.g14726.t1.cds [Oikopleura dioica]